MLAGDADRSADEESASGRSISDRSASPPTGVQSPVGGMATTAATPSPAKQAAIADRVSRARESNHETARRQSSQVAPAGSGKGAQEWDEVQSWLRSQQRLIYALAAILLLVAALLAGLTIALLCVLLPRTAALEEDMAAVKVFVGMMPPPPSSFDGKPALQAAVDLWCIDEAAATSGASTRRLPLKHTATSPGGT